MAMNPLKEMVTSNKKRGWYVLNEKGKWPIIGSVYESTLRVVFTKRLYEAVIPQRISNIRNVKADRGVRAIGGRDVILEGERDLHSAAGKGLRWLKVSKDEEQRRGLLLL